MVLVLHLILYQELHVVRLGIVVLVNIVTLDSKNVYFSRKSDSYVLLKHNAPMDQYAMKTPVVN